MDSINDTLYSSENIVSLIGNLFNVPHPNLTCLRDLNNTLM